jgi:AsmA protein
MRKFLLILLGLVVVLIGAALAVPFLVPTDTYKQQIARQVEGATGRSLTIDGPLRFTILPHLGFEAQQVTFANPPGATSPQMVRLKTVEVELKVWPLLRGTLEVDRFVLVEPKIDLEVDPQGRPNWRFGTPPAERPAQPAEQPEQRTEPAPGGPGGIEQASGGMLTEVKLGDVRIENGALTYTNAQNGSSEQVDAINMTLRLPDLESRLEADGALDYKGQTITLQLSADQPAALLKGGTSPVALTIETTPAHVSFAGQLGAGEQPGASGKLDLNVSSIRDLAAWLAQPIALEGEGLRTLKVAGQLDAGPQRVALTGTTIGLDAIEAKGEVVADLSGAVPKVDGHLDLGAVNLDPYLPPPAEDAGPSDQAGAEASASGWSDEPIAVPPIGGANVDFALSLESLTMREIEIGKTAIGLKMAGNTLNMALNEMALYGGKATGNLEVAVADGVPAIHQQFQLDGLEALPFLTAVAGFERLEGKASAKLDVASRGGSQLQLVRGLNGNGSVTFTDGAIVGINIAAMVRNAATAFLDPTAGEQRKTDFAELSGTFAIRDGILTNDDMRLQAPVLRVNGRGRVDLPARTLTYLVEPTAAPTLEGQGGAEQAAGVLVPVIIEGPWNDLKYRPDLSGVIGTALRDPEAIKKQVEQLGGSAEDVKRALEGDAGAVIKGLTGGAGRESGSGGEGGSGGQGAGGQGGAAGAAGDAAKKLLKGLFDN